MSEETVTKTKKLPGQHVGVLSRLVAEVHNRQAVSGFRVLSMESLDGVYFEGEPIEGYETLAVHGPNVHAKKDVRRLLFTAADEDLLREESAVVSFYDVEEDVSYLQLVSVRELPSEDE